MGRDPLDTSLDVLIDQALSVAAQLRRTEVVRVSFATIGIDAHALADTVAAARATANHARAVRDREAALTLVSQEDGAALLEETQFWVQRTRLALSDPNIDAPHAAAAVLATLRHVRTLRAMATAVRTPLQALLVRRDQLSGVTHIAALIDAGAALADRIDKHKVESETLYAARAVACASARAEAGALRATLRDVRRTWRAAAIGNRLMPPFDLRLAAAATANRRTGPRAADPAAPPADAGAPPAGAPPTGADGAALPDAEPAQPCAPVDLIAAVPAVRDDGASVILRHALEVRVVTEEE
jgi:hypothetical protein